ncbi:hypothetical protein D3C81_1907720 [compost metagenome]
MDGGGARQSDGLAEPVARQILLIARMAGFVHHAKQGAQQLVFIVTGGDAHVFRHAAAERMGADVETPGVKIEAQHFHRFQPQLTLNGGRERALWRNERFL